MKRIIRLFVLLMIPVSLSGQLTPYSNQYILNPLTINPAFAGNRGVLNMAAFYRKQWGKRITETMSLSVDVPFSDNRMASPTLTNTG